MEEVFRVCEDETVKNNIDSLKKDDILYEYIVNNNVVGYGLLRTNEFDRIQIYINKEYENQHFGTKLFGLMLNLNEDKKNISVPDDNAKMIRIIYKYKGKEIGRNRGIITYKF